MRPYLVLFAVILISTLAFGQQPLPSYGACLYGCAPFVPLVSTPMVSLQQYSPNPVGATNATTGLVAGATNGTLSEISGSTSSVYTVPVWYQGGAPLVAPSVHILPEPLSAGARRQLRLEERAGERRPHEEARANWMYFSGTEFTANAESVAAAAKGGKKATRTYTNEDVERQNQNNGMVKYDGKSEKIQ